ncbi:hypothetical protein MM221_06310 [Salipaludibacillus sp. LMS25]|uniref:glycosyltransferase n=1 Tax=Salipaludibacillus sp. LMS25 TaxID=2924031 RepID=UPI0020D1E9E9|nr:glycosyltransferase [Salipaludibacillus sp. LMS25]UTR16169.1 hypothetical protein MM221_06310 [Salipaludibacillus sp. LMS25]
MKILIKNRRFNGGAPLSLLEYAKVAKKNNLDVSAVGAFYKNEDKYKDEGVQVYDLDYFNIKRPFKNVVLIYNYIKLINKLEPDLIHSVTELNILFHKVINPIVGVPVIYTIPGGEISDFFKKFKLEEKIIVFSEENLAQLKKSGYDMKEVILYTNRMSFNPDMNNTISSNNFKNDNHINLLLITRIDQAFLQTIKKTLCIVKKLIANHYRPHLIILGDGDSMGEVKRLVSEMNESLTYNAIILKGHVKDPQTFIMQSDVVFGKGRSIIESIICRKISFVISYEGEISICNLHSLDNLMENNFSGREMEAKLSLNEFINTIINIKAGNYNLDYLASLEEKLRKVYDIKEIESDIINLYTSSAKKNQSSNNKMFNYLKAIKEYMYIYIRYFMYIVGKKLL